jgi:hypothetical protein
MPPTRRRSKDFCGGLESREKAMSEIPSLSSLRFRGGPGQERGTGTGGNLNLTRFFLWLVVAMGTAVRNRSSVSGWTSILPPAVTALLPIPRSPPAATSTAAPFSGG